MKRGIAIASTAALAGVLALAGCSAGSGQAGSASANSASRKNPKAGKADAIKYDEIELTVEEGFWYDTRKPVFTFTNNSDFDVITVEIEFSQKEDVTEEQRAAVFSEFMNDDYYKDDDFTEYVIDAYKEELVAPGETSQEAEVALNHTGHSLENVEYFDYFEPSILQIAYLGGDGKAYLEYYDFKTGKYKDASSGGKDITEWSDSELAKMIPEFKAPVRYVTSDSERLFSFDTLGVTAEDFAAYVDKLKKAGFDQVKYDEDDSFAAYNKDGYEAEASYSDLSGSMWAHVDASEVQKQEEPEASANGASAEVSSDFKQTVDEYEAFFDTYVAFMAKYKEAGSPAEMMADYNNYMNQYFETMSAISEIDASQLSEADAAYLLEAQGRINLKLATAA